MNEQKNERNGRFDELSDCVLREWKTCLRWEKAKRQRTLRRFMLCGEGRVPRLREVVLPNPYSVMFSGGGFPLSSCCFGLITELVTPFIINPLTLYLSSEPQQNNSDLGKGIGLCVCCWWWSAPAQSFEPPSISNSAAHCAHHPKQPPDVYPQQVSEHAHLRHPRSSQCGEPSSH